MDADLIRDFSMFDTFSILDQYPHNSTSVDSLHDFSSDNLYEWDPINEREIHGDLPLIPTASNFNEMDIKENSQPSKENFQKIMDDWLEFVDRDTRSEGFSFEYNLIAPEENQEATIYQKNLPQQEIFNLTDSNAFDIASYLAEDESKPTLKIASKKRKAAVKKMDLIAQRYIVEDDEDDVDVETISESECSPVLEAGDLNSLLEQFEATEMPELPRELPHNILEDNQDIKIEIEDHCIKKESDTFKENNFTSNTSIKCKPEVVKVKKEPIEKDVVKIKKEYKVDVQEKIEIKNELHNIKKEKKEVQIDMTKVKQECQQVTTEFKKPKVESVLVKEETPSQITLKVVTSTQIPTKYSNKIHKEVLPQKIATENKTTILTKSLPQQSTQPQQSTLTLALKVSKNSHTSPESTTSFTQVPTSNYIRNNLPHALIERIKESGKRKTISVIPPIPSKKRGVSRAQVDDAQDSCNKKVKLDSSETVQLDHDYCSLGSPYPKDPKKDSGFESAEEDDRAIIQKQPMVKNADGKLMVSLLKVNTIHSTSTNQKKKLNLEEYKKRRKDVFKIQNNSQNCSPNSSNCSSPLPEDENLRIKKHQQKLMKMALEVLKTSPKGEKKPEAVVVATPPAPVQIPSDMEKKILVSIGVNTDFKICKNINPVAPVEQLEEIKPLLKRASAKINCNSLITSLIENIPKVMNQTDCKDIKTNVKTDKLEHGEDKTIVYLPKDRIAVKTASTAVQTNISLIQQSKRSRYRKRRDSSTSDSSSSSRESEIVSHYKRRRESSNSSVSSRRSRNSHSPYSGSSSSSSYSSRSTTPSRSRSSSPKYSRRERERLREVEERRVIYVGRISSSITRDDLRRRFQRFGPITNVSLHFRDHGDNYGFVTFANKLDAYEAIEHGNDDPYYPKYDLSFGGRRIFCKTKYSDLDNMRDETNYLLPRAAEDSFDKLLREAQEKLRKRKA